MTNCFTELLTLLETSPRSFEMSTARRETIMDALRIASTYAPLPAIPHATDNEKRIVGKLVTDLLAAGLCISVNDGEDFPLRISTDADAIYAALSSAGEDYLIVHQPTLADRWVRLIWGNDVDVISDYQVSLEKLLTGANALAVELER